MHWLSHALDALRPFSTSLHDSKLSFSHAFISKWIIRESAFEHLHPKCCTPEQRCEGVTFKQLQDDITQQAKVRTDGVQTSKAALMRGGKKKSSVTMC